MTDAEYIAALEKILDDVFPQMGGLCIQDYGNLNAVAMEQTRRQREIDGS
jgi:hypothetical protein